MKIYKCNDCKTIIKLEQAETIYEKNKQYYCIDCIVKVENWDKQELFDALIDIADNNYRLDI